MRTHLSRVLFLFLLFTTSLFADIVLEGKNQDIELSRVLFFEDETGSFSLKEIQKKEFRQNEDKVASFGFTHSVYWFKIAVEPGKDAGLYKWWLHISYPILDKLDLYICDEKGALLDVKKSGKDRPFEMRELKDHHFSFQLDSTKKQTLYLRVDTQSSMQVPLSIQTSESIMYHTQHFLLLSGVYYGLFILILFYNLISFIYTRNKQYFLYLIFISSFILYQLSLDGTGIIYFWSEFEWMKSHGSSTMMAVTTLAVILFSREFLKTKSYTPRIDRYLSILMVIVSMIAVLAPFVEYGDVIAFIAAIAIILPPLLLVAGVIVYKKGFYPARLYVAGWSAFLFSNIIFAMNKLGWIGGFEFIEHAQQIGSALEMIFLSWALADLQKQSEREYIEKVNSLNTLLQDEVDESLLQIRKNDQILIEKSRLAAMGEMIEQIAHQWRQPLHTLALLNQSLYFKVRLKTVKEEDYEEVHERIDEQLQYMSQTIDDFRNFSKPDKEKEIFYLEEVIKSALNLSEGSLKYAKINGELYCDKKHEVYGIRHEMMQVCMNFIKNVQDIVLHKKIEKPWIRFYIEEAQEHVVVYVKDNAGGIDSDKISKVFDPYFSTKAHLESSGIGLYMSKEIIEKSMGGTISVVNGPEGAIFSIVLPKAR